MTTQSDKNEAKGNIWLKKIILNTIPIVIGIVIALIGIVCSSETDNDYKGEIDNNVKEDMVDKEQIYDRALVLISEKKYAAAYDMLNVIKDYPKAQSCMEKFEHKIVKEMLVDSEKKEQCTEYEYDEDGNCILAIKKLDKYSEEFIKYAYDKNRCVNETWVAIHYGDAKIQKEISYSYNENTGFCISKRIKNYSTMDYNEIGYDEIRYYYGYENDKVSTEKTIFERDTEIGIYIYATKNKKIYEYNDKGLVKAEKLYSYDTYVDDYVIEYEYDDMGRIVKKLYENHSQKTINEYFYNEKGYITKETGGAIEDEKSYYIKNYVYDADGKLIKEEFQNTQESYMLEYSYDEYGRVMKKKKTNKTPHISEEIYTYEYEVFYAEDENNDDKTISNEYTNVDIEKIYAPKIEEYKKAVHMDYESFEKEYENGNLLVSDMLLYFHRYGGIIEYSFYDVDKNGVDELMFSYDNSIIDVYTTDGKEIVELNMPVGERSSLYILSNGIMLVEGSESGESSGMTKYYISTENGKVERERISYIYYDGADDNYDSDYENYSYMVPCSIYYEISDKLMNMSVDNEIKWNVLK